MYMRKYAVLVFICMMVAAYIHTVLYLYSHVLYYTSIGPLFG